MVVAETQDYVMEFQTRNRHNVKYNIDKKWKNSIYTIIDTSKVAGRVLLYNIAHSRSGDKGDTANVSLIPYNQNDFVRLQTVITKQWVRSVYKNLLKSESEISIYTLPGIGALNIVLNFALDGGVCVSRRIDRHGKTLTDFTDHWRRLDREVARNPMPVMYKGSTCCIICNDCEKRSKDVDLHFIGQKCSHCGSYNTTIASKNMVIDESRANEPLPPVPQLEGQDLEDDLDDLEEDLEDDDEEFDEDDDEEFTDDQDENPPSTTVADTNTDEPNQLD
eukprot:gene5940-6879_t